MKKRMTFTLLIASTFAFSGCSAGPSDPGASGGCEGDKACAIGSECVGGGCVPNRPTLYPHINLASPLLRPYLDPAEIDWRGANTDMVIGIGVVDADRLRAQNPNLRIFEYFTNRYYIYEADGKPWAWLHDLDAEDFFLHYREDISHPGFATTVLVPGFAPGMIPGWNPNPGPTDPPASATSREQARVIGIYLPTWPLGNLVNPGYRQFLIHYVRRLSDGSLYGSTASERIDGVVVDNAVYYPQFNEGMLDKTEEFYGLPLDDNHPYGVAHETFYRELKAAMRDHLGGIDVMANYGHVYWLRSTDRFSQSVADILDWAWGEVWISYRGAAQPLNGGSRVVSYDVDYNQAIIQIVRQTRAGGRRVLGARDLVGGGIGSDRGRLFTLALYYLVHNANTFYAYEADVHGAQAPLSVWQSNPAVTADIGQAIPAPAGFTDFEGNTESTEHFEFATGPDPFDPGLTYHVLARRFTNGLVLVKMLPAGSIVDSRSATTHTLDRSYHPLRVDGTLGPLVNQVTLMNNQGAILVLP